MRNLILFPIITLFLLFHFFSPANAQVGKPDPNQQQTFIKGKVLEIVKDGTVTNGDTKNLFQILKIQLIEGKDTGKIVQVEQGGQIELTPQQKVHPNDTVILTTMNNPNGKLEFIIYDSFRLNTALYVAIGFFLFVILFTGRKGIGAIAGLIISLLVIVFFIVPQLLAGHNPLFISIIGSIIILLLTSFLAHGFSNQTTLAVFSSFVSLNITAFIAVGSVFIMHLAGLGTEDATILQLNTTGHINVQGLLLGGIIIGTLGALNDVTTTQVAAVSGLFKANSKLGTLQLAEEGFIIGREHMLSLVNTLILAYAGSALAIFIFFVLNPQHIPIWVILNSESVMEEFVRTVTSSVGLILAVPISTFLAAWYIKRSNPRIENQ